MATHAGGLPVGYGAIELFVSHRVGPDGIERRSPWTGSIFARWSEVELITFSGRGEWYKVRTVRGVIRASVHLDGIGEFERLARRHVPRERRPGLL